ncbi:MAG: glycosyltransferase family 9 protein [Candidatus Fermentibacteraceae bacterium]|nr:glycosyltransferase family 9 protein [Candidatus Fermentibacteraceae bacterium]
MNETVLIRLHSLGDIVLTQPVATELSLSSKVKFITSEQYAPVVERMPGDIEAVTYPSDASLFELRKILKNIAPEKLIDLQCNFTTKIATQGMRVWGRFRMNRKLRHEILGGSSDIMPLRSSEFLRVAGLNDDIDPVLERRNLSNNDRLRVGIVVGGRWRLKSIPDCVISELSRLFIDLYDAEVILLGDENDRADAFEIAASVRRERIEACAGGGGTDKLIDRIETMDLLISPDSGPAHLAKALGIPVLVVFTSTSPVLGFWRQEYEGNYMVNGLQCRPCHRHGGKACSTGTEICRRGMVPHLMVTKAMEMLQ